MKNAKTISIVSSIVFIAIGAFIFFNPDVIIKFISYFVGGLLVGIGVYKVVNYYIQDKKDGVVNRNEVAFGATAVILGILFIFLAGTIELILRFIIGGWLIIAGLARLAKTFNTTERDAKFYALIIVGFMLVGAGLYIILVSNLAISVIGLFMMIYGLIDLVTVFVYKDSLLKIKDKDDIKEAEVEEKTEE